MSRTTVWLTHNRARLAMHCLRDGEGRPLLLLHGLGEQSPHAVPPWAEPWRGPVWALDFTGHGESEIPLGGGYSAEILLADDGGVTIDVSREASLQMDNAPTAGAQSLVSLWQNNMVALRAERFINWKRRRLQAVGYINSANYVA